LDVVLSGKILSGHFEEGKVLECLLQIYLLIDLPEVWLYLENLNDNLNTYNIMKSS